MAHNLLHSIQTIIISYLTFSASGDVDIVETNVDDEDEEIKKDKSVDIKIFPNLFGLFADQKHFRVFWNKLVKNEEHFGNTDERKTLPRF